MFMKKYSERMLRSIFFLSTVLCSYTLADKLNVAYEWEVLDFAYSSDDDRQKAVMAKEFMPENNLPVGLEVYGNRLFITVPRWKYGVAASLAYIDKNKDPMDSPILRPYPNWDAHRSIDGKVPEIVSPFRIRADQCGRLWVLDSGDEGILESDDKPGGRWTRNTSVLIYDLTNDALLRTYTIPDDQVKNRSFFANIAVEDEDCENTFAYFADFTGPGLVVYSWKTNQSWKVIHNYFNFHPLAATINVLGTPVPWAYGLYGLALRPEKDGYSTLFFHPFASFDEFSVSTSILRDEAMATNSSYYHHFKHLGSRGPKSQSGADFLDKKTGVLFYSLANLNAIACWRTTNPSYTMESQGRIYMNNVTMVYPSDVKVDNEGNLWVLSNRLPQFMHNALNFKEVNYRVMTVQVSEAIKGSACASKLNPDPDIMNKLVPKLGGGDKIKSKSSGSAGVSAIALTTFLIGFVTVLLR